MDYWPIWLGMGGIVALAVAYAARRQGHERVADASSEVEDPAELGHEARLALLVRDRSRYARNYAKDMLDRQLSQTERQHFRQLYEAAKSNGLNELLAINDDFYRGVATHGVIDLLLAGSELAAAKRLFETLDKSLQDSIVSTEPAEYACLRGP